ncbi:RNA polymerase sigma factor [Catellatospora chokoriensis]|uniref:DNA-directed RNA polymerase sigma-70 factor n=1 Tax=Catellatospora chokoriensis TaxID=310353 RepID=A0A8J3NUU3_9ACTN|nr:sigma-70 family RNA polymerase sigma factor [Catellatospora chokoriensis]GIF93251.1 DNA-directed RNA polymerase sigma-70 factor [Catellatospora chokoriensis]
MLIEQAVPGLPDEAILRESRTHPELFAQLFDAYHGEIYRYVAGRLSAAHADDLAAETFLIAFRGRARFGGAGGHVRAWLYGIATNLIRRHHRDEERKYRALARADAADRTRPGDHDDDNRIIARVAAHGIQRDLAAALRSLKRGDRDVLLLVALAELTYPEVAEALGIPEGTVASRLSRARKSVRTALGGADPTRDDTRADDRRST